MELFDLLYHITPIYMLYLFYGAAFLFLGVSIASKNLKGSDLGLASSLWMLAMFGFLHGAHEWLHLGLLIEKENLLFQQINLLRSIAAVLVLISFMLLLQFGISLVSVIDNKRIQWLKAITVPLFITWVLYVWYYGFHNEGLHFGMRIIEQADLGARYIFGVVGSLVTAYGLISHSREVRSLSRLASQKLYFAGITFGFYAVFEGVLRSTDLQPLRSFPIELLRGASVFLITYFIAKAMNIFDIEAKKKMEEQLRRIVQAEKLFSLGQLAAGIAHEINNPLTNASLGIQTLRNNMICACGKPEIDARLDVVERNIDKASLIARELLQFSRQKEDVFVPLNVNNVISGALTLLNYKFKNVAVTQKLQDVPDVMGDPGRLEQVIINVLSNSVEAMPAGGEIDISTFQKDGSVTIRMADTGAGISEENLSRVFDPFFTTKGIGVGTGLGLSISYSIVRQHRGCIDFESVLGKGTIVTIRLPAKEGYEKNTDC